MTQTSKKPAPRRIYAVATPGGSRLVRTYSPASAIQHCARTLISAEVADQEELVRLLSAGITVEDAGVETDANRDADQPAVQRVDPADDVRPTDTHTCAAAQEAGA